MKAFHCDGIVFSQNQIIFGHSVKFNMAAVGWLSNQLQLLLYYSKVITKVLHTINTCKFFGLKVINTCHYHCCAVIY